MKSNFNFMSQDLRSEGSEDNRIYRTATEGNYYHNHNNGFEGMNFEQFRQPYKSNRDRNSMTGERKDHKRPDES